MYLDFKYIFICMGTVTLFGALVACVPVERSKMIEQTLTVEGESNPAVPQDKLDNYHLDETNRTTGVNEVVEQTPTKEGNYGPWKLVWQDEFDGRYLDENNWTAEVNDWGGGNHELQYYTDRNENVYVENGFLNIVGRKEQYLTRNYTSARLTSTRSWVYGRFEVRADLPEGQGIWPAIWLRSATNPYGPWPTSGEIDIMEMLGQEPNVIYGTLHYGLPSPHDEQNQESTILRYDGFHIFAVEWDADEIRWYADGSNYLIVDSWHANGNDYPAPFDQPFNIVLNLAIGGTWPGNPDKSTSFPQKLLIDYVRVYQR